MDEQSVFGCLGIGGLIILIVILIVGGSFRAEVTYVPPNLAASGDQTAFRENFKSHHWLCGLIKGKQPDIQKATEKFVRAGEQITKLTIITKHTIVDYLLTGITLTIYSPMTVTVKGSIARI
jgi:hypothetical protein